MSDPVRPLLALLTLTALALADAPPPPAAPAPAEIDQAVRDLGGNRFAAREAASKKLWLAGAAAEPALRRALASADAEVVRRAKALLDKFDWGIYPDTPAAVLGQLERYRDGDEEVRRQSAHDLAQLGRPGFVALSRLRARAASDDDRQQLSAALTEAAAKAVPPLLAVRDFAAAEALVEECLDAGADDAIANYTALVLLRGRLDAALARWQADVAAHPTPKAAEVLAALCRAKGDYAAARRYASGRDKLLDDLVWEQGDWKELARRPAASTAGQAAQATYHRLAGDADAAAAALAQLARLPAEDEAAARALLLNERPADAIARLGRLPAAQTEAFGDKAPTRAVIFDLLVAQQRYAEAFALADGAPAAGETDADRRALLVREARAQYQIGEPDRAGQSFARAAELLKTPADADAAEWLVQTQARLGLKDAARDTAARYLGVLARRADEAPAGAAQAVLEAAFPKRGAEALTWWRFLRQKFPRDDELAAMKRLRDLLGPPRPDGAAAAGPGELGDALLAAQPKPDSAAEVRALLALAAACEAAGQAADAGEHLRLAAERSGDAAVWLRLGDLEAGRQRFAAAAGAYAKAAERAPADPLPLYLRGWALARDGRAAEAKAATEQAHALPLGDVERRATVADELAKRDLGDLARRERELVRKLGWRRVWATGNFLVHAARDAVARKDFARAADCYERIALGVLANERMHFTEGAGYLSVPAQAHAYRARAALAAGKLDGAKAEAEACLALTPGNLDLAILLVPELARHGRTADADALYGRAAGTYAALCRDHPQSAYAHNAAAWLAACCRRDLDAGLGHARKAAELAPKYAGYRDTLAEVHFQRGETAKAIELMKECLRMEPKNGYFAKQLKRFEAGDPTVPPAPEGDDD